MIPEFAGDPTIVTVLGAVPPFTVRVSYPAVPAGTPNVEVEPRAKLSAAFTVIDLDKTAADPFVSVAVMLAVYEPAATAELTINRAYPDDAVEVSNVIPAFVGDTEVSTKLFTPVPFEAVIVSSRAVPEVTRRAVVVSPRIVVAGLIVTFITETTLAPTASVAVIVSM